EFRDALALYDSIIQYSDSALLAEQCRNDIAYQEAVVLEQAKDYAVAIKMYKAAQGYADSQMRLTVCTDAYNAQTYYKALDLERSGDFAMAMKYYRALGDYADSARRLSVCEEAGYAQIYSEAQVLEGKGEFKAARDLYVLMPQYRDSAERVKTCDEMLYDAKYIHAAALLADGSYQEALDIYMLLNGYKDSAQLVIFCGNKLTFISAETHQNEMRWIEAYEEFSSLGDFEEAASRAENCLEQIYREAKLQEENQDYQQAVKSYLLLSKYGYKDSSVLALYCQNMLSYLAAEELYLSNGYQAAETSFLALGEFLDARIKAGEARKILNRQALSDALSSVEQGDFTILLEMLDSSRQLDKETRDQLINSAGSIIIDLFKEAEAESAEAILAKLPEKKMIMDTALALEQSDPLLASRIWGGLLESDADTAKAALLRIAKDAGTAQLAAKSNSYALLGDMMAAGSLYLPYQSDLVSSYNDRTIMVQHDGKLFINNVSKKETAEAIKWKNITAAAIGEKFIASLQDTGAVKIAGDLKNKAVINKWTKIIRISAGGSHLAGLTEEGTVVSAGIKDGRIDVSSWTGISAISSAGSYTLGLTNKGTVLIAGAGSSTKLKAITDTWTDIVGIAACTNNICYGLKSDGTVVAASLFLGDGADLSPFHDIVAISGRNQSPGLIALRADGALLQLKSFIKGEAVTISYPESAGYVYAASTMNGWIALGSDGNTYTKAVPYKSISLLFKPQIRQQGGM
ncbi:MAG: hypothetical protein GX674_02425, partial [Clostridiales bacterium]|nr:hypothetical protein [Clostridiales bacterium]